MSKNCPVWCKLKKVTLSGLAILIFHQAINPTPVDNVGTLPKCTDSKAYFAPARGPYKPDYEVTRIPYKGDGENPPMSWAISWNHSFNYSVSASSTSVVQNLDDDFILPSIIYTANFSRELAQECM